MVHKRVGVHIKNKNPLSEFISMVYLKNIETKNVVYYTVGKLDDSKTYSCLDIKILKTVKVN